MSRRSVGTAVITTNTLSILALVTVALWVNPFVAIASMTFLAVWLGTVQAVIARAMVRASRARLDAMEDNHRVILAAMLGGIL